MCKKSFTKSKSNENFSDIEFEVKHGKLSKQCLDLIENRLV